MAEELMRWVRLEVLLPLQEKSIAQHGGLSGIRDQGLLVSALARPQNMASYGRMPDVAQLAAAYAFGIVRNHPFLDGNKRAGFIAALLFLRMNGYEFELNKVEATLKTLALAAGDLSEDEYAVWLRGHITLRQK